jgi:hypothetical protein
MHLEAALRRAWRRRAPAVTAALLPSADAEAAACFRGVDFVPPSIAALAAACTHTLVLTSADARLPLSVRARFLRGAPGVTRGDALPALLMRVLWATARVLAALGRPPPAPALDARFLLSALPKRWTDARRPPSADAGIFSGYTHHSGAGGFVAVFRREEAPRVLVHELLHWYGVAPPAWRAALPALSPRPLLLAEAFTDALACRMNAALAAESGGSDAARVWRAERDFVELQAAKIVGSGDPVALPYYVIKAALLRPAAWRRMRALLFGPRPARADDEAAAVALCRDALAEPGFLAALARGAERLAVAAPRLRVTLRMSLAAPREAR